MKKSFLLLLLFLGVLSAEEITVAVAANVRYAMAELKKSFETKHDINLRIITASSGKLAAQIGSGAPFDLFLSANMKYPKYLRKEGLALTEPRVYAKGSLVLWSCKPIDLGSGLKILTDPEVARIAIANPKNAPYGTEALKALKKAGIYESIASKLIFGESVSQTNRYIVSEAADAGITAKSVVRSPKMARKGVYIDLDPSLYDPIEQGVVLLKHARKHHFTAAKTFYDFLFGPKAKKIFEKYGYFVPPKETR